MKRSRRNRGREHRHDSSSWTSGPVFQSDTLHSDTLSEVEIAELQALQRIGQRRQRRYLNEKFLRDLNPTMTPSEMATLYQPAPSGDEYTTVFTIARAPENAPLWDLFRSVDPDKQARVLFKWEEYVKELQQANKSSSEHSIKNESLLAATFAYQGWMSVGHRNKKGLHRAPLSFIEQLESSITEYLDSDDFELVLELDDAYQRLLAHGLAEYYFLTSFSRDCIVTGCRHVVLRRKKESSGIEKRLPRPQSRIHCSEILWLLEHVDHNNLIDALLVNGYHEDDVHEHM